MKHSYKLTLFAIAAAVILGLAPSVWAQSELIVEWGDASGNPIVNALRNAIINDTARPADRVYVLKRGGYYHITDPIENPDFHLRIRGQESNELAPGETDYGKAIIQKVARADGSAPDGTMFRAGADFTLKNVWVMGITSQGSLSTYEPIQLLGDGERFTFDRVTFDRNDWHHIGANGPNSDFFFTNCIWRNQFGLTQIWEGRGVRFNAGADTVVFENNTMFNVGSIPIQAESATPVNYMRVNHNTFVNVGRNFGGNFWKEFYMANNVWVNYQWHGRYIPDINPNDVDPRGTFFGIANLPAGAGTNASRKIVLVNNSWWRDPAFETWYPSANIQPVPFLNDTTQGWFDAYPNMLAQGNYADVNPGVKTYPLTAPGVLDSMKAHIVHLYGGGGSAPRYWWDPGRDWSLVFDGVFPETVDFSYTNAALLTGATDGLPVGDLNWFPDKKAVFEANKAQYVSALEKLVTAQEERFEQQVEVEVGTVADGAELIGYTYPVVIRLQEGPSIKWSYTAASAGTYTLRFNYNLSIGTPKGQKIHINGQPYVAGDADVMFEGPGDGTWLKRDLDVTLAAGANDIEIIKSWGWMYFGDLEILQAGAALDTLGAIDAVLTGDVRFEKLNAADPNPPSGWYYVSLPDPGSSVAIPYDTQPNAAGTYVISLVYSAATLQQAEILANGTLFTSITLDPTAGAWAVANISGVPLNASGNSIRIRSVGGGLDVDRADFYRIITTGVNERSKVPEGYALWQNYPNPFNPTTNIHFALGKPSQVKLTVYNVLGQKVATLLDHRMNAGTHTIEFDASRLTSGVYFYRLEAGDFLAQRRMLLIK
jgi:hypothetical protein